MKRSWDGSGVVNKRVREVVDLCEKESSGKRPRDVEKGASDPPTREAVVDLCEDEPKKKRPLDVDPASDPPSKKARQEDDWIPVVPSSSRPKRRPLALGFDPGAVNAGFASLNVDTNMAHLWRLNFRLKLTPSGWRYESSTEVNMERWIDDFLKAYDEVFSQAYVLGIESPQQEPIFSAMTWVLKYKVMIAYPHIKVYMVDPKYRTKFFHSSAATYAQRKKNSWLVFERLVGADITKACKKVFQTRGKPTKHNSKGVLKYLVDPIEAFLYAVIVKEQATELERLRTKPSTISTTLPKETVPIDTHSFSLSRK